MNLRQVLTKVLEWRSESSEIFVLSRRLFFFGLVCFGGLVKMFCIWIIIRCYFAFLSMDIFVFFTRYSLRYLSLKLFSIYTLSDLGVLSNLIGSLSLANEHYSPPTE